MAISGPQLGCPASSPECINGNKRDETLQAQAQQKSQCRSALRKARRTYRNIFYALTAGRGCDGKILVARSRRPDAAQWPGAAKSAPVSRSAPTTLSQFSGRGAGTLIAAVLSAPCDCDRFLTWSPPPPLEPESPSAIDPELGS